MLPQLTEMKWNWITFTPPMVLSKIFDRSISGRATWNSQEKMKSVKPPEQNQVAWLVKSGKTVFSKLTQNISQMSKHIASSFPLSDFQILPSLSGYLSGTSCTFHFGQMFNGFLTSTFDFHWSCTLPFSCIMVRLSQKVHFFLK